uniref:VLIG-type G domain-containing protein n=1 Tax=Dicentrarchus labrax TaxID=13489 RepID=A0A8P4GIG2_DICLA
MNLKLTPADFLKIGPPVKQDNDTCEKDLAHTFLQRLMMLDYRARYIPVRQDGPGVSQSKPVPESDTVGFDALFTTIINSDQTKQTRVHPMDIQMAVFHCSDSFLKQNMITKLSQCQYALPLLVPDPVTMDIVCPLWTFRQIRKTWKIIRDNTVTMKSMPICKAQTPMVSFFRLGSLSLSKSQLMNTLINERHSTFFHRNCPGSTKSRHLMEGVAEIAWYCPAGRPNDAFTDCIAFCNLHGDALLRKKQRDILTEKSSVNVVLVPTLEKGDKYTTVISALFQAPKPLIIIITDNDSDTVEIKRGKYKMGLKERSQSEVSEELKGIIGNILSGPHESFQLETMAGVSGIRVDEDDTACQKGKSAAMKIVNLLQGMDVSKIKDTFFPRQGQLWHKWCRTNKELYHLKGDIEKEECKKEQELKTIRQKQCKASCSELMKLFIESLSSLTSTEKEYFLKWTQILIDALSTDDLSLILQSYDEKWSEVVTLKNKHDKSDQLKNIKRRLQEKLDRMAQLAAKEEVCEAECFSDVIAFDVQKDVKYFAQLWEGSPPMAPPNPGYRESVQELKNFILSKASQSTGMTLSEFKSKIQDLWKALLNENFVFSFKNTLEIAVYRELVAQYGNWTGALRSNMLTTENELYTRIENGTLDKVEVSFLHEEMKKTYEQIKKDMTIYFEDNKEKDMLVQWRGRFETKIKEFHDEQVRGVKRKLDEVIQQKNACKKLNDRKTEFETKLLQKSKELAHQLKDKAKDEEELKKQFDSVWRGWVSELTADTKPIKDISYEEDQSEILLELGFEWALIAESKHSGRYKKISEFGDYSHFVSFNKYQVTANKVTEYLPGKIGRYIKEFFQYEDQKLIRSLIDDAEKQSLDALKSKPVATRGYSPTYLQEVAKNVKAKVTEFESKRKYALKKDFTVDLILYVFDRAWSWLSESHRKFKMNNDALTYLESKKSQYYNIFRSFCKGNSSAVVLRELICEKVKSSTVEAVCNQTAIDLAGEMRCKFPAFSGNRLNLEKHLLRSLAEKEDFNGFINYIKHPRKQVETFIKEEVKKYIFIENKHKAHQILKKNVEDIKKLVSLALFTATNKVKTQRGDIDMWVEEFSSVLKAKLTFDTICCQNFSDVNNFNFLKEETERGLESIMKEMSNLSLDKMEEFRLKPDQILIDQLCKCCWVKCPFCAAVCTNTLEDHSPDKHSVPFHRPSVFKDWHTRDTDELDINFCTTSVASDGSFHPHHDSDETVPYKQYQKAGERFATWQITPDECKLSYWKWFVCRFQKQLEDHYKLRFHDRGEIPNEWREYSKQEAIESLDEM